MPDSNLSLIIEPLDKKCHDRTAFDCGTPALNSYIQRQATQDVEKHAAVVYVALLERPAIAGYYTLSQFSIDFVELPQQLDMRLYRYPVVSATLLGRLAVAVACLGKRLGETLLFDALHRSLRQSAHIASAGVIVDAKNSAARSFYLRYGFTTILGTENRLFLPMKTLQQIF